MNMEVAILNETSDTSHNVTLPAVMTPMVMEVVTPLGLQIFKGTVMSLITIATILGNSLVIAAVAKFKWLRTLNNFYIMSLAVADILVGKICVR